MTFTFFGIAAIGFTMALNSLQNLDLHWTLASCVMAHWVTHTTLGLLSSALVPASQTCCNLLGSVSPLPLLLLELFFHFLISFTILLKYHAECIKIMTTQPQISLSHILSLYTFTHTHNFFNCLLIILEYKL